MNKPLQPFLCRRLQRLRARLEREEIDALVVESPLDITYLTGLSLSKGRFLVSLQGEALFVDPRYFASVGKQLEQVVYPLNDAAFLELLQKPSWREIKRFGFDGDVYSYSNYQRFKHLIDTLGETRGGRCYSVHNSPALLKEVRAIKDEIELDRLRRSVAILFQGFKMVHRSLREGISERELALKFELYCRQLGAEGLAFAPIIAFGENGAYPHHQTGDRRLRHNESVLVDLGVMVDGYASDMTRVIFFGQVDPTIVQFYRTTLAAYEASLELCRVGTKITDLDAAARTVFKQADVDDLFLHRLGHGIGLEVHEEPILFNAESGNEGRLESGMIFTLEPGLYRPGVGGVRFENMIVIHDNRYENLLAPFDSSDEQARAYQTI